MNEKEQQSLQTARDESSKREAVCGVSMSAREEGWRAGVFEIQEKGSNCGETDAW